VIPMCFKCASARFDPSNNDGIMTFRMCVENPGITNFDEACQLCPLLTEEDNCRDAILP